jgi:virulence-associated protein VapD
MDQVREVLRSYHYAYRTEQTYADWIKRFLKFYGFERHPKEMGTAEVERKIFNTQHGMFNIPMVGRDLRARLRVACFPCPSGCVCTR